jgi:hypothetical protein
MLSWSMSVRDYCERSGPGFWAEPVNALSNVAFLLAGVIAFRRWRHVGGNDLASLGLIAVVAAGVSARLRFTPWQPWGRPFLMLVRSQFLFAASLLTQHRFLRPLAWIAVSFLLGFVVLSALAQRLAPIDIFNGSIGYVPALAVMGLVGVLALPRARIALAREAAALGGMAPTGEPERARKIAWLLLTTAAVFVASLV